jgi:hypothetical protein
MKKKSKFSVYLRKPTYLSGGSITGLLSSMGGGNMSDMTNLLGGLLGNNQQQGSVTTGIIAKPFVDKIEDPTTKAILTGLTQGPGGLLNLLNQNLDKKMQPNADLLAEISKAQQSKKLKEPQAQTLFETTRSKYKI